MNLKYAMQTLVNYKLVDVFFFEYFYPFRIMQLLLFLHESTSLASLLAFPHVSSVLFKSPSKAFLKVIFGLPCFFLPGGLVDVLTCKF